ncbi:hypothetical protein A2619_05715 [candidate division WWE3 bacterium RIFOXYD1_FULL_39_9]|nr:MAG: hypothetical protein A2619_05715 [candidate division WWE3 bacterium RIFOXYD1_FULL_39_9]
MRKEDDAVLPTQEATMEPANESTEEAGDDTADKNMDDNNIAKSRYVQYSKSALESASGNRRVLFFYASWCPTCKPADTDFTQNSSNIPEDVTVIRVNYNDPDTDQEEKDLAKKYGITYQHTFVQIDSAGKELTKWNGGQTDALLSNIK